MARTTATAVATTPSLPRLVRETVVAEILGISTETLQSGRCGRGSCTTIPWIKIGRSARYDLDQVRAWLAARTVNAVQGA